MSEKYSVLLDKDRRPVVINGVLWVFSPAKAASLARELDRSPSEPLDDVEVWRLATRLGVDFASVGPDHLLPAALRSRNAAYRYEHWRPSRWAFYEFPTTSPSCDVDRNTELMFAPSEQFTGVPRETAPEEYASSGELLKTQRERAGLTQGRLAEKSGVPERTIRRLENGENEKPQSATVRKLAKALGIRYAALLGREWDETQWDAEEIPYDPTDEASLGGLFR